jgi:hypothetical protein
MTQSALRGRRRLQAARGQVGLDRRAQPIRVQRITVGGRLDAGCDVFLGPGIGMAVPALALGLTSVVTGSEVQAHTNKNGALDGRDQDDSIDDTSW